MADRTFILTGAGAPEWCRALLETGKFIRLWRGQTTRQASGLYGASHEAYPYGGVDWRNPPRGSRNERPAKSLRYDKTRRANKDDKEPPDFEPLSEKSRAPEQGGVSTGYALRASAIVTETVLRVLRDFPDIFRTDERGSTTVIDCASQAKARDAVLRRIYDTLPERESA